MYRIVQHRDKFFPQQKVLWWWSNVFEDHGFDSYHQAKTELDKIERFDREGQMVVYETKPKT